VYNSSQSWLGGGLEVFSSYGAVFDRGGWNGEGGIEFEAGELPSPGDDLEQSFRAGMEPVVSIDYVGYGGHWWGADEKFPHTTVEIAAYVEGFVKTATAIREAYPGREALFEVMNQPEGNTTPEYYAEEYANVVAAVLPAARLAGIPLEDVYVTAVEYGQNAKEEGGSWIGEMYEADPSLESEVRGWAAEPYGPPPGGGEGIESLVGLRKQMRSGENNVLVSAVGFCATEVAGGYCKEGEPETVSTGQEAGEDMTKLLTTALGYHEEGWLKALIVFARGYGGYSLQLENGEITAQGKALIGFAEAHSAPRPVVRSIAPNNGAAEGGTAVTITGSGFAAGSAVTFGSQPAAHVVVNSWTSITATSPEGSGTVAVQVTSTGGTTATSASDLFAYDDPSISGPWLGASYNSAESWNEGIEVFSSYGAAFDAGG
jgi:hypothetical protein